MKTFTLIIIALAFPITILAQWTPRINISPNAVAASLNENAGQCLAVNGDTVHVVWSDHRSQGHAIYYRHSLDSGITWNTAAPITDTTGSATFPAIAVNGLTVHVVWLDTLLGVPASFYKRSLDGGNTWEAAVCLDSNTKFWPGVATSGSMVFVTLNKELVANNTEVFFRRSIDNGITWETEQQLSNANGRSEDPAIAAQGSYVHLSWNDNRNGPMEIYYRRSADGGSTWGLETQLTTTDSYSSMVSLDGASTDVPYGSTSGGNFDVWFTQSSDTGTTFAASQKLTNELVPQAYPFMIRRGPNIHLVYFQFGSSAWYLHSDNGGATWDSSYFLGSGGQPFIALTGCALQVIFPDSGAIYYMRNPTGNCFSAGVDESPDVQFDKLTLSLNPNPASTFTTIQFTLVENKIATLKVYDILGHEVANLIEVTPKKEEVNTLTLDASKLKAGVFCCQLSSGNSSLTKKFVVMK